MITFEQVSVRYADSAAPALGGVDLPLPLRSELNLNLEVDAPQVGEDQ
ncbi:hypothetical protein ACIQOV_42045 [Kitasatospora sp. NPDC091257]